jgi:AcrR family transcriptional regulator
MEDHIILHKSIIDDWKFKDEGVLKFWILLLVEELEAQKDEDGLFGIRSLTKIAKKVGVTRQTAHRLFKKMETVGDIELLCSYFRGEKQKSWNMN